MVDVEVSIANHENRELLRACLRSLPAACAGIAWHTTVIDNVSGDGSLEMLAAEFADVGVIANRHRRGFGANHNQVLRRLAADGSARYALVLNDDTELAPAAVTRLVELMDGSAGLGAVVPRITDLEGRVAAGRLAYPTARTAWHFDRTGHTEPADPEDGWLQGCCILLRMSAVVEVGPFDERFFLFYEDTDLSRRLVDAGWGLGVCPDATVVHRGHASVFKPGIFEVTPKQGLRSRYLYFRKHLGRPNAELITAAGRSILLGRAAKAAIRGRGDAQMAADARRLLDLARFNPRRPLAQEVRGMVARAALDSEVGPVR